MVWSLQLFQVSVELPGAIVVFVFVHRWQPLKIPKASSVADLLGSTAAAASEISLVAVV